MGDSEPRDWDYPMGDITLQDLRKNPFKRWIFELLNQVIIQ